MTISFHLSPGRPLRGFNIERIGHAAPSLGLGQHACELAKRHTLERRRFGWPIAELQNI
jgi:alkylation response protein AidB-like acyl-CoA dehydrogenase